MQEPQRLMSNDDAMTWNGDDRINGPRAAMIADISYAADADRADVGFPFTDYGNAERLVAHEGEDLRFAHDWQRWLMWNGQRWQADETDEIMRLAKRTARCIRAEALQSLDNEELFKWAQASESGSHLREMVRLAQSEQAIATLSRRFDAIPWLLNCADGTIDLRTGECHSSRREDMLTKQLPVPYDSTAACPHWEQFLDRIMAGKAELVAFLQRVIGYALTGDTREQVWFLLYGTGANGKSTFLETLRAMLGDYAQQADFSTFLASKREGIRNDVARMQGVRFIAAIEAEAGRRWSEVVLKQLTGGDTVSARFLYREFFDFLPTAKIFLATNHKPKVAGTDHAFWRRVRLIPFSIRFWTEADTQQGPPELRADPQLKLKLRAELPGILAWAVRGCLAWQREGLGVPSEVIEATNTYRQEMDVLQDFLDECCTVGPQLRVLFGDLYKAFVAWCEANGEQPLGDAVFRSCLDERGFAAHKGAKGARFRLGLALSDPRVAGGEGGSQG